MKFKKAKTRQPVPAAHELIQGLSRVIDGEAVGKPCHDSSVSPLINLRGKEEGVTPEADPHGVLETLHPVAVEELAPKLVHRGLLSVVTDQGP